MSESVEFEKLTAEIFSILRNNPSYETVIHNTTLQGKDGPRQIDILLIGKIGPLEILTIIECKDYNKNIDVTTVDALHSKMEDVNAHKAVLVARKGFSKQAIRKSKRLGITLCTAYKAQSEKWEIPIELPVVIEEITPLLKPAFTLITDKQLILDNKALFAINDINILSEFKNDWNNDSIAINNKNIDELYEWQPKNIIPPFFIRNTSNEIIFIKDVSFHYTLLKTYYFGYLNKLNNTKAIQFIIEDNINLLYNISDLINYKSNFMKYNSLKAIPNNKAFMLRYLAIPKVSIGTPKLNITKIQ
jgi:hypothetical protein